MAFCPGHSKWDQIAKFTTLEWDNRHPHYFHINEGYFINSKLSCYEKKSMKIHHSIATGAINEGQKATIILKATFIIDLMKLIS